MMKIKTILLAFGLLLVIGIVMFVTEGISATSETYEVMVPGVLFPGDELTPDQLKMLLMLGVLRPEGVGQPGTQYAAQDGERCHLKVYGQGTDIWVFCDLGPGTVNCACSWGTDPATE